MLEALWRGVAVVYVSDFEKRIAEEVATFVSSLRVPVVVGHVKDFDFGNVLKCFDAVVFVSPISIAVRVLCGNLVHKSIDPPVVVVDPGKRFVIPIVGAHWGANDIALELSKGLRLEPVITTASDIKGITSVEQLARIIHCHIEDIDLAPLFDAALLRGEEVCVQGVNVLPSEVRGRYVVKNSECRYVFFVSTQSVEPKAVGDAKVIRCTPYKVSIGIGVHSDTDVREIAEAIKEVLGEVKVEPYLVKHIVSVKPIVGEAAKILGVPFKLVSVDDLNNVNDPCLTPPSQNLAKYGVRGVAELCALIGCSRSQLVLRKRILRRNITVAIASCRD